MRGVKSQATRRREVLESKGKIPVCVKPEIDAETLAKRRKNSVLGHAARGRIPEEAVPYVLKAIERPVLIEKQEEKRQKDLCTILVKNQQLNQIEEARNILKNAMPDMAKRLAAIVRGQEKGWGPREQLQAMKLSAEIVSMVDKSGGLGGEDAPLSQQTVGTLRQVIAAGEARIAELQAQLDGLAVEGEAVQVEEGGPLD